MGSSRADVIVIGGSSGSIPVVKQIINALPVAYPIPIIVVIHRLRNVPSDLAQVISSTHLIHEPEDKEPIQKGHIYLAPQNYHLLIEDDHTFSMDYSEQVNYSRPSIDVTFMCTASVYRENAVAVLLSGANKDGADGISAIIRKGGRALVQDPLCSEYPVMPEEAIKRSNAIEIQDVPTLVNTLLGLPNR